LTVIALLERWANGYDWGVHERRIGEFPGDGGGR
jgi:hypothetical protein